MTKCKWCGDEEYPNEDKSLMFRAKMLVDNGKWERVCLLKSDFVYVQHYSTNIQVWKSKKSKELFILRGGDINE